MKPRVHLRLTAIAAAIGWMATAAMAQTVGPGGESPTLSSEVTLTDAEVAQDQGDEGDSRPPLAHLVGLRECGHCRRQG